jgi:hypothetical protein
MNDSIHNEANFQPENYSIVDYFDNQPPRPPMPWIGCSQASWNATMAGWEAERAFWDRQRNELFPNQNIHKCIHCGCTNVRYVVSVEHKVTHERVVFGDVCVEKLAFANRNDLKAAELRAKAAQGNASIATYNRRCKFLEANPELNAVISNAVELNHPVHANNEFVKDIISKLNQYGELSPAQVSAFISSISKDHERLRLAEERRLAEIERLRTAQPAPTGRVTVQGEIVYTRVEENQFGISRKMMMLLTTGAKVWLSIPSDFGSENELKGRKAEVTATFTPKQGDQFFAFGKRPSKARLITV